MMEDAAIPPIIVAAGRGDAAAVVALLESGADANTLSPEGETPLHVAAITGDAATTSALIGSGAIINARAPSGTQRAMTPLQWASYGGHVKMIELLLQGGADPTLRDEGGLSASQIARNAGHPEVAEMLEHAEREFRARHDL